MGEGLSALKENSTVAEEASSGDVWMNLEAYILIMKSFWTMLRTLKDFRLGLH